MATMNLIEPRLMCVAIVALASTSHAACEAPAEPSEAGMNASSMRSTDGAPTQDAADNDAAGTTITYTFGCSTLAGNQQLSGVEYCPAGRRTGCGTTGTDGKLSMPGVPANAEVLFSVTKAGYVPLLKHFRTPGIDAREAGDKLLPQSDWDSWAAQAGVTLDPKLGHFASFVFNGIGSTVVTRPEAGTRLYLAQASEGYGPAVGADTNVSSLGVFFNLAPGEYDVVFSHPDRNCAFGMEAGWPGSTADAGRIVVKPGMLSWLAFGSCLPRAPSP